MPTVLITGDDGLQRVSKLPERSLRIGRSAENDVVLPDANKGVSRAHAELRLENGQYVLVDLQSQNGTWMNGERIERAVVPANAEITIGLYRLRLQAAAPTSVAEMPLYRPERAAAMNQAAAAMPAAASISSRTGISKWVLFGGGVAIGMVAILVSRIMAPPPASPTSASPAPAVAPSAQAPASVPAPATTEPPAAAPSSQTEAPAPAEPGPPQPAASTPAAPAAPQVDASERTPRPSVPSAARTAAREAFDAGSKLDAAGDWMGALRKYDDAHEADASLPGLDRAVKNVWAKLRSAGSDALKRARQYDAIGLSAEALKEYDKAAQWLPPDDPNRQIARGRADQLRNGVK